MSVLNKKWNVLNTTIGSTVYEKLLNNRKFEDPNDIQEFFNADITTGLHDPFMLLGMREAVERIKLAVKAQERIIIYGDYDADGISGSAILVKILKDLGAKVSYRIPHRINDGYGLKKKIIDEASKLEVELMITVDCGIANADEITYAKKKGIDIIITDHHKIPAKFPEDAYAVVHPLQNGCHYPFKGLTGSGVAFKLAHALIVEHFSLSEHAKKLREYVDLASLGTVGDLGPLIGENRVIVKEGVKIIDRSYSHGLRKLVATQVTEEREITGEDLGFRIIPHINASGRMDTAYYALQLLTLNPDETEKIDILIEKLNNLNLLRRSVSTRILEDIEQNYLGDVSRKRIITAYNKNWHIGVLGLVAGQLVSKYNKPVFLMQENDDRFVGSARCPDWFNVTETLVEMSKYLESFGGHNQAAGFTLEKKYLKGFMEELLRYCIKTIDVADKQSALDIDCELNMSDLSDDLFDYLLQLSPFGIKNPKPIFIVKGVNVTDFNVVGNDKKHFQFKVNEGMNTVKGIAFKLAEHIPELEKHTKFDIVFHLDKNYWNGQSNLQLNLLDIAPSI